MTDHSELIARLLDRGTNLDIKKAANALREQALEIERLKNWAQHLDSCEAHRWNKKASHCDCGLTAFLAALALTP